MFALHDISGVNNPVHFGKNCSQKGHWQFQKCPIDWYILRLKKYFFALIIFPDKKKSGLLWSEPLKPHQNQNLKTVLKSYLPTALSKEVEKTTTLNAKIMKMWQNGKKTTKHILKNVYLLNVCKNTKQCLFNRRVIYTQFFFIVQILSRFTQV